MKKFTIVLFILAMSGIYMYGQNEIPKFGDITYPDMMRTYELKDKSATACVVFESGRYTFTTDFSSLSNKNYNEAGSFGTTVTSIIFNNDVQIRIHILKPEGVEHATFEIPYHSSSTNVDKLTIEGYTYNVGENEMVSKTPLDPATIIDEEVSGEMRVKRITMPNVREGSIVELHYMRSSLYEQMPVWNFQKNIPVVYSQLRYHEGQDRRYVMILKGAERFDVYEEQNERALADGAGYTSTTQSMKIFTYGMRNLEAFNGDVDFLRNAVDYRIAVHPQLSSIIQGGRVVDYLTSWPVMRKDLLSDGNLGRYMKSAAKEAEEIVPAMALQNYKGAEKIKALVDYVKKHYTWDGTGGAYVSKKLSPFMKEKTGNTANLNLFLAGMLDAANIEAYPVVLRLRSDGTINRSYPFRELFNYVVVQAIMDGKVYYLDASNTYAPFDMVSADCIDVEGFVLKPKSEEWVLITNPHPSTDFAAITLAVDSVSGVVSGDVVELYSGLNAVMQRKMYDGDRANLEAMVGGDGVTVREVSTEDYEDTEQPFQVKYRFETALEDQQEGRIIIDPLLHLAPEENIFTETRRQFHIDFISKCSHSYSVSIAIPEGYAVEHLPAPQKVDNREVSMIYSANESAGVITVDAQFTFKSAVYPAGDYNLLKKYYGDMITAFSGNIILVKTDNL